MTISRQAPFAGGQLYVALSRVKSIDGLSLRRPLSAKDLVVNSRVREFAGPKPQPLNMRAFA